MRVLSTIIIGLLIFSSCKKPEDRACFKSAGDDSQKEIQLDPFEKMLLGSHLKYELVQDTVNKVILRGPKNLLNLIELEISDNALSITNGNKCNFLRSYNKEVTAEIHFISIYNVLFEGTKPLICKNQLQLTDFTFAIKDGAGEVTLDLNANSLNFIVGHGWGNFVLNGNVNFLKLDVGSNGFGSAYNLQVMDSLYAINRSPQTIKVNAENSLMRAEINGSGDIWYIGSPTFIDVNAYGSGELLDQN